MMDHTHLDSLCSLLGKPAINQIRLVYVEESIQKIALLNSAWEEKNFPEIRTISHSIKSSSLNMGLSTFSDLCSQLEEASSARDEPAVETIMAHFADHHKESIEALETYFLGS